MATDGVADSTLRVYERIAPAGRPLTSVCLLAGYLAFGVGAFTPGLSDSVRRFVPYPITVRVVYLVTFAYPATFVVLGLVATYGAVEDRIETSDRSRRDRIHAYLAIAFAEWTLHHLLYVQFPLALVWAYLSLSMGVGYAIPVWTLLCISVVGVLVGNRYMWYHDPEDLPAGVLR